MARFPKNASGCICYFITIGVAYFDKSHKASYNCAFIICDFFPHNSNTLLVDSSNITGRIPDYILESSVINISPEVDITIFASK